MRFVASTILCLAFVGASCVHKDTTTRNSVENPPTRASQTLQPIGTLQGFGLNGVKVTVDLSRTPRADQWGTGSCYAPLPTDFALGQATCHGHPELTAIFFASQTLQTCAQEEFTAIQPVIGVVIPGCDAASFDLAVYPLTPNLKITLAP